MSEAIDRFLANNPDLDEKTAAEVTAAYIVIKEYGTAIRCSCGAYHDPAGPCPRCGR